MPHPETSQTKILLIDDDPLIARTVMSLLERNGYRVTCVNNADEGISSAVNEDFNLIISDIRMPGKNGVKAMEEIRQNFKDKSKKEIPIIFITGYSDDAVLLNAEGIGEVILKPFDANRFLMTILEYL